MKVAIYVRISTSKERQDFDTQLFPVRDYCKANGYEVFREYQDEAPARDSLHRVQWRQLLDDAAKHRFKTVVVFKLDRAFRSVKDMHDTLTIWEALGIEFISVREAFNTTTASGRLLMNIFASLAEFELELIRERVIAGMDRAQKTGTRSGKPIGRGAVTAQKGYEMCAKSIMARVKSGGLSLSMAVDEFETLGVKISKSTIKRLKDGTHVSQKGGEE